MRIRLAAALGWLVFLWILLVPAVHAVGPLTYNMMSCNPTTSTGDCAAHAYSPFLLAGGGTTTLPNEGQLFMDQDFPRPLAQHGMCGNVNLTCEERVSGPALWTSMGGSTASNPCGGAPGYSGGAPEFHTTSGTGSNIISLLDDQFILGTAPGGDCTIIMNWNPSTGAYSFREVPKAVSGGSGELVYSMVQNDVIWAYPQTAAGSKLVKYDSSKVPGTSTTLADLNVTCPSLIADLGGLNGGSLSGLSAGGWSGSQDPRGYGVDDTLVEYIGDQNHAVIEVMIDLSTLGCEWVRFDKGDVGGTNWPAARGGVYSCSGCAPIPTLSNPTGLSSVNCTSGSCTAVCATTCGSPVYVNGIHGMSIKGNSNPALILTNFNMGSVSGNTFTFTVPGSVTGSGTGGTAGQQNGIHGSNVCGDGSQTLISMQSIGSIAFDPDHSAVWAASATDGQGHRTCGMHSVVAGPTGSGARWLTQDISIVDSSGVNEGKRLGSQCDQHNGWQDVNSTETNFQWSIEYCNGSNGPPDCIASGCLAGDDEVLLFSLATGLNYRAAHTRKNVCSDGGVGCGNPFFYAETSGVFSPDGNWGLFNSNLEGNLGTVTQGGNTVHRDDVFMMELNPVGVNPLAPKPPTNLIFFIGILPFFLLLRIRKASSN